MNPVYFASILAFAVGVCHAMSGNYPAFIWAVGCGAWAFLAGLEWSRYDRLIHDYGNLQNRFIKHLEDELETIESVEKCFDLAQRNCTNDDRQ